MKQFFSQDISGVADPSNLFNSLVVPRPIAFVTTVGENGIVNAAPFSYFNVVSTDPALVSISIQRRNGERKDTARNIALSKEFVINICSLDLAKAVSIAAGDFPSDVSEIELAELSLMPSSRVMVPRVANTLAQMECVLDQIVEIGEDKADLILGRVLVVHTHKDIISDSGRIDIAKLNPLSRLAGITYARTEIFCDIPRGL